MEDKGFKPETMRLFVKLDKDGKYHEYEGVRLDSICRSPSFLPYTEETITLNGINTHISDEAYDIFENKPNVFYASGSVRLTIHPLSKRERLKEHLPKKVYVMGNDVTCQWEDGTKTTACLHDGDEFDLNKGIMICAIKKWMPGGSYWFDALDECYKSDTEVIDVLEERRKRAEQKAKEKEERRKRHEAEVARAKARKQRRHAPVNHDKPCRPYMRGGRYGDDEKMHVIELVESGMTQHEVSRVTGISQGTISAWMKQWRGNE